jgi:predicted acylesterase/phospholipase RssA
MAHIGVLKVLSREKVFSDVIAGISMDPTSFKNL